MGIKAYENNGSYFDRYSSDVKGWNYVHEDFFKMKGYTIEDTGKIVKQTKR